MRLKLTNLTLVAAFFLAGCQGMKAEDFAGTKPELRIEEYFIGRTRAWGIFQDRFGNLRRQFVVDIVGRMEGEELVLVEDFAYADGEMDQRIWRIRKIDDNTYEGHADDVIGAAKGTAYGNALNWRYTMALPVGDSVWNVNFDDWMFLQPDNVLINRAEVGKFGLNIGVVTLTFQKMAPMRTAAGERDLRLVAAN